MKTSKIEIESYKDTGLGEVLYDLYFEKFSAENPNLDEDEVHDAFQTKYENIFEYGEYLNAEIVVDENLNIIGGRVIPFK